MENLLNLKKIAIKTIKVGSLIFKNNTLNYRKINKNLGREIKIQGDEELNRVMLEELKKNSSLNIISEENKNNNLIDNDFNWILDPIDGSFNFHKGIPFYCISLALWYGDKPIFGYVKDLKNEDLYYGIVGDGAYKNEVPISVSKTKNYSDASIAAGFPVNFSHEIKSFQKYFKKIHMFKKTRMFGSAAMSLSYLASGKIDAYFEENIMIWDVAAGIAIVQGAGGQVDFKKGNINNSLIVEAHNKFLPINK